MEGIRLNRKFNDDKLRYPIAANRLFGISLHDTDKLVFDKMIPSYRYETGIHLNPAYVCWWGILNLEEYLDTGKASAKKRFMAQADWLQKNGNHRKGATVWTYDFDHNEGKALLKAPWISAMSQGLAMSVLVRAYRLTKKRRYLETANKAARIFSIDVKNGGVRSIEEGDTFYEEYPSYPLARVLDGFIFSLFGLHDLYLAEEDAKTKKLFDRGVACLRRNIGRWDFRRVWSWYGTRGILCTPMYNKLNSIMLLALHEITGELAFKRYSEFWSRSRALGHASYYASLAAYVARQRLRCAE